MASRFARVELRASAPHGGSAYAAIALPLAFHGLEILTTVVRDIAATIAHDQ